MKPWTILLVLLLILLIAYSIYLVWSIPSPTLEGFETQNVTFDLKITPNKPITNPHPPANQLFNLITDTSFVPLPASAEPTGPEPAPKTAGYSTPGNVVLPEFKMNTPTSMPIDFNETVETFIYVEPDHKGNTGVREAIMFPKYFSLEVSFSDVNNRYKLHLDASNNSMTTFNEVTLVPSKTDGNTMIKELTIVQSAAGLGVSIFDPSKNKIGYVISDLPPTQYGFKLTIKEYVIDRLKLVFLPS
jgi:hypothetical protein